MGTFVSFLAGQEDFVAKHIQKIQGGYLCEPCGKAFTLRNNMNRHVRDKHIFAHLNYQCPLCPKILVDLNQFSKHVYTHHKELKGSLKDLQKYAFDKLDGNQI